MFDNDKGGRNSYHNCLVFELTKPTVYYHNKSSFSRHGLNELT